MSLEQQQKLNFLSEDFDPLLALTTPGLQPPVRNAGIRDNISREHPDFKPLDKEPASKEAKSVESPRPKPKEETISRQEENKMRNMRTNVGTTTTTKRETKKEKKKGNKGDGERKEIENRRSFNADFKAPASIGSLLHSDNILEGPLALLKKFFETKQRVFVRIRSFKGLRGFCVGYLRAFDKHMNLVLADCDEYFAAIARKGPVFQHMGRSLSRRTVRCSLTGQTLQIVHRNQTLLRGDNVVLVTSVPPAHYQPL